MGEIELKVTQTLNKMRGISLSLHLEFCTIKEEEVKPLPYSEMQDKEKLIQEFSKVVFRFDKICRLCSEVASHQYTLRYLARELRDSSLPTFIQDKFRRNMDSLNQELQALKEAMFEFHKGCEALVKYYQSMQYIVTSHRLGGYD